MNPLPLLRTAALGISGLLGLWRPASGASGTAEAASPVIGAPLGKAKPKRFARWAAFTLYAALIYHFLLWPVLSYHFPHYGFPPIDAALLSVLAGLGV